MTALRLSSMLAARTAAAVADPFDALCRRVQDLTGIALTHAKKDLVQTRLAKRFRATGCPDLRTYMAFLAGPDGAGEEDELVRAITTNVTHFFREPHHFEHFTVHAMPLIRAGLMQGAPARVWSAGCSDGREAYSIAATALAAMPDAGMRGFRILATDIDTDMIERAKAGVYDRGGAGHMPAQVKSACFTTQGGEIIAGPAIRKIVSFMPLNLIKPWPMRMRYQAIFCRNVLIYFDKDLQMSLVRRFADMLVPGGYLYLGHSERVLGPAADSFQQVGVTTFLHRPEGAARRTQ